MSFPYKQIGVSAAWVVSVLAIAGGLLWWERGPDAYPAPHPQDEAEIETAVLERDFSMGRTNVQFTSTYPDNVSQVIASNTWSNLVINSSIQIGGTNYLRSADGTLTNHFPKDFVPSLADDGYGDYTGTVASMTFYYNAGWFDLSELATGDTTNWTTYQFTLWDSVVGNPVAYDQNGQIAVDPVVAGVLSVSLESGTKTNHTWVYPVYEYITNSLAHADTNTIGYFSNAANQYANAIRSAIDNTGPSWASYPRSWLLPDPVFMTTGLWDGEFGSWDSEVLDEGRPYWSGAWHFPEMAWWTNYVARDTSTFLTTTNYSTTNIVWTNFPPATNWFWQTNILWRSQLYTNTWTGNDRYGYSTYDGTFWLWTGYGRFSYDPYQFNTPEFAFERDGNRAYANGGQFGVDSSSYYWSTNLYNDFGRALSLMQWQRQGEVYGYDYLHHHCYGDPNTLVVFTATNDAITGYAESTVTNVDGGWPTNAPYLLNDGVPQIGATFGGSDWINLNGRTQLSVQVVYSIARLTFSNSTVFSITNGIWWPKLNAWSTNATNYVSASILTLSSNATSRLGSRWAVAPGCVTNSEWFPVTIDDATILVQTMGRSFASTEWERLLALAASGTNYYHSVFSVAMNHLGSPPPDMTGLPNFTTSFDSDGPVVTYRVQFSALTNYLNHIPVR